MKFIGKFIAWVGASLMMAGIFGFIAVALVFEHYSKDLPGFAQLAQYSPPVVTRLYADDGKLLAEYAKENRIFVPLKAIPPFVQQAFIAAEDKNFYQHKGVDITGIARAVRENINNMGTGRSMVGGSTITQQVVKNFLLTSEKSFERKIKEAILAYRISNVYSKNQILELYLNEIYLGRGSYGVAVAALNYFNKSLEELTTEEVALLAALPKAPNNYNPETRPQAAMTRRNYVIERMQEDGYIDETEARRAMSTPIELQRRDAEEVARADFFAEEVRRTLAANYGSAVLYEGGLTVRTTVNSLLQNAADKALRDALVDYDRRYGYRGPLLNVSSVSDWEEILPEVTKNLEIPLFESQMLAVVLSLSGDKATIGLPSGDKGSIALSELKWARQDLPLTRVGPEIKNPSEVLTIGDIVIVYPLKDAENQYGLHQIPEVNGALVAMDPHTGRVLAMSGGYEYGGSEFNRATQAKRQPGSAFKPFVYLAALENGFTPATILMDEAVEISQGPGLPMWRPQNYEGRFLGPITMRTGLEKSRNTLTVRLAQMLGIGRVIAMAERFGIYSGDAPRNYSMVLGAHETTLLKLTTGYAMIANGGRKIQASLIERIDDRNGDILYKRDNRPCEACKIPPNRPSANITPPLLDDPREILVDPRVAYQMTSILEGVVKRGTGTKALAIGKPVGGKTGTTNDSRDAWFMGYSPDLVTGVYIGYDQPKSLGAKETGGAVALPAFVNFMKEALKDEPATPFRVPPGIQVIQVDNATGQPPYDGMVSGRLIDEAFIVGGNIYRPDLPAGSQEPPVIAYDEYAPVQEGFDPNAGWENSDYYVTPEQGRQREFEMQRQYRAPVRGGMLPPAQGAYDPNRAYPAENPAVPAQGYGVNATNPFEARPRSRDNNPGSANTGTGGLY